MAKMKYGRSGSGYSIHRGTVNADYSPGKVKRFRIENDPINRQSAHKSSKDEQKVKKRGSHYSEQESSSLVIEGPPKTNPFPKKKTGRPTNSAQRRAKAHPKKAQKEKELRMKKRAEAIDFSKKVVRALVNEYAVSKEDADHLVFEKVHLPGKYIRKEKKYMELGINGTAEQMYQKIKFEKSE